MHRGADVTASISFDMRGTKWRRQCELRYSEAALSYKLLVAAMRRFVAALPSDPSSVSQSIGDAIGEAHPQWNEENAPREECDNAVAWLSRLSLVTFVANVELYLDEMEPRVRRVRTFASSEESSTSSVVKRAFFLRLALLGNAPPQKLEFKDLPEELRVLELFVRIRHRMAHVDGSAGTSVQSCLADPALKEAWNSLAEAITNDGIGVPPLPVLTESAIPVIPPNLAIYAGIVTTRCVVNIDDMVCKLLTEQERLGLAIHELKRRSDAQPPEPENLESWVRATLVDELGMERFAEEDLCKRGALADELRRLGYWNEVPGSSLNPERQALQSD